MPNSKKHLIPDAMDNKFELVFNERDDAAELKNLPIDDNMHGIIEEEELDDEGSDEEEVGDDGGIWAVRCWNFNRSISSRFASDIVQQDTRAHFRKTVTATRTISINRATTLSDSALATPQQPTTTTLLLPLSRSYIAAWIDRSKSCRKGVFASTLLRWFTQPEGTDVVFQMVSPSPLATMALPMPASAQRAN